ncbi:MAG: type II toxin-antitoxin system Phd/YefM family antitoxin [Chloroflexota bacterium]
MALVDTADLISISEANKLGVSALVRAAETGHEQVVLRNNKPVAAVVSIERLDELQRLRDELLDVSLATARMLTTGPGRHSLDEVLAQLGYTREQLRDQPGVDADSG